MIVCVSVCVSQNSGERPALRSFFHGHEIPVCPSRNDTCRPHWRASTRSWPSAPCPSYPSTRGFASVAVVVSAGELVTRPTRKGGDASMCTVLVADMSGCSIPLTIWAPTVQEIDVRESQIVDVKARTSVYKSAAQLSAFLEDCTLAASSVEAHELHAGWSRARPEVRPLTPAYAFTPVASLAALAAADFKIFRVSEIEDPAVRALVQDLFDMSRRCDMTTAPIRQ